MIRFISIPNLVTYTSLLAGLLAIYFSFLKNPYAAGLLIAISAICDMMDGRFARLFKRDHDQQQMGVQLDSFVDAITFGIVPVICTFLIATPSTLPQIILWGCASIFYLVCVVTRLAYYNLFSSSENCFEGMPTTMSGILWSMIFLFPQVLTFTPALFAIIAIAMVAPIKTTRPGTKMLIFATCFSTCVIAGHIFFLFRI